jgi:hypothetical protein
VTLSDFFPIVAAAAVIVCFVLGVVFARVIW